MNKSSLQLPIVIDGVENPVRKSVCVSCGNQQQESKFYYVMGGASFQDAYPLKGSELFLIIGKHTSRSDCVGNYDLEILTVKDDSQVDLMFCSQTCLRGFLLSVVERLDLLEDESNREMAKTKSKGKGVINDERDRIDPLPL